MKKEFIGLQNWIQDLLDKHSDLEKRYEKFIHKQRRGNFTDDDRLEDCKKKKHSEFECDEWGKEFCFEVVLETHKEAAHEGVELFLQ